MRTYRQIISDIRSMNKLLQADNIINDRVVLSEIKAAANMIVLQAFEKRKYSQSPNLYTFIPCLEFEQIPLADCCDYVGERKVSISKIALPKIGEGNFGSAVQGIFGLDNSKKYNETNPNRFSNILKLEIKDNNYFWIRNDGRIVITDEDVRSVHLYAYFTELIPNELLVPKVGCNCGRLDVASLCANPLDQKFPFIDGREFDLKQLVYKNLLTTYFNVPIDKQSDNKDETSK